MTKNDQDVVTLTKESMNTLNRATRFRWDRIITQHADGSRHEWVIENVVAPKGTFGPQWEERPDPPAELETEDSTDPISRVEYASDGCEWAVQSAWNKGSCGRGGARPGLYGGLSLCWQHLDACFSDTIQRLRGGELSRKQVDQLVEAILKSEQFQPNGSPEWHPEIVPLIEDQITEYLSRLTSDSDWYSARDMWWMRAGRVRINEYVDRLIEKRLQQKFGEGDNE